MKKRTLAVVGLVMVQVVGCGGGDEDTADSTTTEATTTEASTTTERPTTTSEATTTTEAPTTTVPETTTTSEAPTAADSLLPAVRDACQAAGDGYSDLLTAFIDNGPSTETAALLGPVNDSLSALNGALAPFAAEPGVSQLQESVRLYLLGNEGLSILYAQGETAYQAQVPPEEQEVEVHAQAETAWEEGAATLFGSEAPDAPTTIIREC